ncbi:MAG: hypothetical protein MUF48_00830 [Pirellulaceae bacterium]|jgi:hypothetical protein|nr:hypothetical protein [Pirellulaceae bacterium]
MNDRSGSLGYRRLRAPAEDGTALCDPPLVEAVAWLDTSRAPRRPRQLEIGGRPLSDLQAAARQSVLVRARDYTTQYRDVADHARGADAPLILAGHQPDLVHPGVWFKNFVLDALARRTGGHALHLLIDNDAVKSTALRVPSGSPAAPVVTWVELDAATERVPYEARQVRDEALFRSFGQRVTRALAPLIATPLIRDWWPLVTTCLGRHGNLGRAVAEARHVLEGRWGLATWELPWSQVCDDWPFRAFAVSLLGDAERLWQVHNDALAAYRRVNRVRSHTHPVPDLVRHDDWWEVPFWLWTDSAPQRRPVFVRRAGAALTVTDRDSVYRELPVTADGGADRGVERLTAWHAEGIRLRPRALLTTMFARLVLSDLFVHGIGGAKYDELTDAIAYRLWGIAPPAHLVATATLKLPVAGGPVDVASSASVEQQLRELRYHPEHHLDEHAGETARRLVAEKRQWLAHDVPASARSARHRALERINQTLFALLHERHAALVAARGAARGEARRQAILAARDYAFCLFPSETLRTRLLELSGAAP